MSFCLPYGSVNVLYFNTEHERMKYVYPGRKDYMNMHFL